MLKKNMPKTVPIAWRKLDWYRALIVGGWMPASSRPSQPKFCAALASLKNTLHSLRPSC